MIEYLKNATTCPICGMAMVHSRLRGYHCHNENHNVQRKELVSRAIMGRDFDDSVVWCIGNQETGYHARGAFWRPRSIKCGSIITTDMALEVAYRKPTCHKCLELVTKENGRIGE